MSQVGTQRFDDVTVASLPRRAADGFGFAIGGIKETLARPDLRYIALGCVLLNLVIYGVLVWLGISWLDSATEWLPDPMQYEGFARSAMELLSGAVKFVVFIGWLLASIWLALALANVLAGPLFDLLSERAEEHLLGHTHAPPFSLALALKLAVREIFIQIGMLLIYLPLVATVFVVGLVPLVGQVLGPILAWNLSALWVALGLTGPPLARHGLSASQRVGMVFGHKATAAGFGALGGIPFVSFLLLPFLSPALVVGGTRMFLVLAAYDRVPSKLTEADKALIRRQPTHGDSSPQAR